MSTGCTIGHEATSGLSGDLGRAVDLQGSGAGRLVLIVGAWLWDASLLTKAADENIKEVTRLLPRDWSSQVESALRIFGADRALLLVEAVAVAKLLMLGVAYPFRRR